MLRQEKDGENIYRCRRYPPTVARDFIALAADPDARYVYDGFPVTREDAWCGEWAEHATTTSPSTTD